MGTTEVTLTDVPCTVPARPIVLSVAGHRSRTIQLDGRSIRLSSGSDGLLAIDLTRSTGYHHIRVGGEDFWFATEDAKLGLAGIEAMLAHLRTVGTGWTGQLLFSDGRGLRDAHVVYGWLEQWADAALNTVEAVLAAPQSRTMNRSTLSRRGGGAVLVPATLRLLRSSPREYLEEHATGTLGLAGKKYDPLRVVVRRRTTTLDTVANRRTVSVLDWIARLCEEVLAGRPEPSAAVATRLWLDRARTVRRRPLAQTLGVGTAPIADVRQAEETTDSRYRRTYEIWRDLRRQFGWTVSSPPLPRFSYVDRSDSIYQAYAASMLAQALHLKQTSPVLGASTPAFAGAEFDLYYDTHPPAQVLRSWRAGSSRPDTSRPDLLLHERVTGRVALLDAKYRAADDGRASEDSRKDVTAYLGLYGLDAITILYPGPPEATISSVQGQGRTILEVSARPPADLTSAVPSILATLQPPAY